MANFRITTVGNFFRVLSSDGSTIHVSENKSSLTYFPDNVNRVLSIKKTDGTKIDVRNTSNYLSVLQIPYDNLLQGNGTPFADDIAIDTYLSTLLGFNPASGGVGSATWGGITGTLSSQTDLNNALNNKVDKVVGKGLSTEDYSTAEKNKLASITEIFTTALKTAYDSTVTWISTNGTNLINHLSNTSNPHAVTKSQVGLGNVDNTSDLSKPISTATQTALDNKRTYKDVNKVELFTDFLSTNQNQNAPFGGTAVNTGTNAGGTANLSNAYGVVEMSSSTTANSGYVWSTSANCILLKDNEFGSVRFMLKDTTDTTHRFGFHDCNSSADAIDGCYLEVGVSGASSFKASSNSVRSNGTALTNLSLNVWYRMDIQCDSGGTSATMNLYDATGVLLQTSTVSSNMPTGANRFTGFGAISTSSGTTAKVLSAIDMMYLNINITR